MRWWCLSGCLEMEIFGNVVSGEVMIWIPAAIVKLDNEYRREKKRMW